ncbi:Sodium/calcium exchanger membrane region [Penicillium macrosclerotiorum]|uniref:Sodium/calcium exchanger membrane region n=1 Tax=Penicillium macrosclerotiorum TaxID=303699 RepID=UPI0025492CBC|nr:Sodium/calcium exchanger membrane region [Penicillium macrosclerotiorum]KAJ5691969.1 Sodium/calcium exchanger membrane region [Penicillium macrosclerotiorum]
MVAEGSLARNQYLQQNSPYPDNSSCEENAALISNCGSERNFGGDNRFQEWGLNQQATVAQPRHNISRQLKKIFSKDQPGKLPTFPAETPGCDICDNGLLAFKHHGKVLLKPRNSVSITFSIAAILLAILDAPAFVVFVSNLIAIIPLSVTLTFATEKLARDLGETAGALLNISIGNLAELIIFITALMKNNIRVVQASLLGSVLVNLLLVLGSAIIAGGVISPDQIYNSDVTQSYVGLLNLTVSCLMIPSAFYGSVKNVQSADHMALAFSRGVSVILLAIYFLYLFFQFKSHPHLFRSRAPGFQFEEANNDQRMYAAPSEQRYSDVESQRVLPEITSRRTSFERAFEPVSSPPSPTSPSTASPDIHVDSGLPMIQIDSIERSMSHSATWKHDRGNEIAKDQDSHHCRNMVLANRIISLALLISSTALIAICAEYFASSFAILNEKGVLGESFVGLIVIPIAGNVAENVTAIVVAAKDQMDLAISVALGSAIQIGLLVAPMIVLAGWVLGKPMSLHFDYFGMVTLVGSVLLVSFIILKGKTNYLEGAILCACFAAISYVFHIRGPHESHDSSSRTEQLTYLVQCWSISVANTLIDVTKELVISWPCAGFTRYCIFSTAF